jgi:hypothetical protein
MSRTPVYSLTRRDVDGLYAPLKTQHDYLASQRDPEPKRNTQSHLIQSGEVAAGAAALGLLAGRLGNANIGQTGIPIGLALGAFGHAVAFFGFAGRYGEHVHNVSDGALAGWLTLWGAGQGTQMRLNAGGPAGPTTSGVSTGACAGCAPKQMAQGAQAPKPLTEAELQAIAQRRR